MFDISSLPFHKPRTDPFVMRHWSGGYAIFVTNERGDIELLSETYDDVADAVAAYVEWHGLFRLDAAVYGYQEGVALVYAPVPVTRVSNDDERLYDDELLVGVLDYGADGFSRLYFSRFRLELMKEYHKPDPLYTHDVDAKKEGWVVRRVRRLQADGEPFVEELSYHETLREAASEYVRRAGKFLLSALDIENEDEMLLYIAMNAPVPVLRVSSKEEKERENEVLVGVMESKLGVYYLFS